MRVQAVAMSLAQGQLAAMRSRRRRPLRASRCSISPWLAPAPSQVTMSLRRYAGGSAAIASSQMAMWSAPVFDPALPWRIIAASGSSVLSR
jgi:hypothetical protein